MTTVSPYIEQAMRRREIPISVVYDEWAELWGVGVTGGDPVQLFDWWGDAKSAREDYLDLVAMYGVGA